MWHSSRTLHCCRRPISPCPDSAVKRRAVAPAAAAAAGGDCRVDAAVGVAGSWEWDRARCRRVVSRPAPGNWNTWCGHGQPAVPGSGAARIGYWPLLIPDCCVQGPADKAHSCIHNQSLIAMCPTPFIISVSTLFQNRTG